MIFPISLESTHENKGKQGEQSIIKFNMQLQHEKDEKFPMKANWAVKILKYFVERSECALYGEIMNCWFSFFVDTSNREM